ncbi:MAG: M16 family metallopeptidase [Candidatus Aminicenantia bacterium]
MIHEEILPNSIKVIHEHIPFTRTVSLGIWVKEGSRDEPEEKSGILHFLEHMLFKSSQKYNSKEIAVLTDRLGGEFDAFTSKEYMGINFKVLDKNLEKAVELISNILLKPLFPSDEIERERRVILEEIKSVEDDPEDLSLELFFNYYLKPHPLGRSILGTEETLKSIQRKDLIDKYSKILTSSKTFITSSGSVEFEVLIDIVKKYLGGIPYGINSRNLYAPQYNRGLFFRKKKELEQIHMVVGFPGVSQKIKQRYAFLILNQILAGGFSSRLFQRVREERGLVYNIGSAPATFIDCGIWTIFCSANRKNLKEILEIMKVELDKIKEGEIKDEEIESAKEHIKGSFVLNLESTSSRMSYLARNELYFGEQFSVDFFLDKIDSVETSELKKIANDLIDYKKSAIFLLGDLPKVKEMEKLFTIFSGE